MNKIALPIDPILSDLIAELEHNTSVVLQAAPGSGKTTRVPPALLAAKFRGDREVLVLEPRRLAAKMAAHRVAEERGERIGETIGYQFRFESVGGPKTKIRFLTEGLFVRRLLSDPQLKNVAVVVVDEFHERHLQGDVALGALKRLQRTTRPDLRIVVMSATLDSEAVAAYLGNGSGSGSGSGNGNSSAAGAARIFRTEGRRFDVTTEYMPSNDRFLDTQVERAVRKTVSEFDGDILVFLPGIAEIRRAREALLEIARREKILVVDLYGDLSREEQDVAVRPADRRKIILSTNLAETSVTIEGVRVVIDSGLARVASYSHWSGLPALRTRPISRASAIQRAGRAGRTASGHCIRLYTKESFETRPAFEVPEIFRADLAQTILELKRLGVDDARTFPWFEPPAAANVDAALKLLYRLGALDEKNNLTKCGEQLVELPAHPRLARLVVEGARLGFAAQASLLAALIGEGGSGNGGQVDLIAQFERYQPDFLARKARDQILQKLNRENLDQSSDYKSSAPLAPTVHQNAILESQKMPLEQALRRALLAGFPDRVARRRELSTSLARNVSGGKTEFVLSSGGSALLEGAALSGSHAEYFVTVDIGERAGTAGGAATKMLRSVCAIEPDWLFDLEPMTITEKTETRWDENRKRVDAVTRLMYDGLIIDESPVSNTAHDNDEISLKLTQEAWRAGLKSFCDQEALDQFMARARFLKEQGGEKDFPDFNESFLEQCLREMCRGRRSFAELKEANVFDTIQNALTFEQRQKLDQAAPEFVQLPGGRRVRVHYESGKPPWIESRLQDFFGMKVGPSVLRGRMPLTLHLLAPNMRAVQVTSDLSGFWVRVYPELRRELGRRYPRHKWPEDPLAAQPDGPRKKS